MLAIIAEAGLLPLSEGRNQTDVAIARRHWLHGTCGIASRPAYSPCATRVGCMQMAFEAGDLAQALVSRLVDHDLVTLECQRVHKGCNWPNRGQVIGSFRWCAFELSWCRSPAESSHDVVKRQILFSSDLKTRILRRSLSSLDLCLFEESGQMMGSWNADLRR